MKKPLLIVLSTSLLLAACSSINESSAVSYPSAESETSSLKSENETSSSPTVSSDADKTSISVDPSNFVRTISAAGTHTITGNIDGSILIDAPETDEIELILDNATITSYNNSPIYCKSAGDLKIKLTGTNVINDRRPQLDRENEDPLQGKGAIYSKCDLKITSSGSLTVNAAYNNGIHCTDDVKFKSTSTINVTAVNHAVKGNDSVSVESGNITLISKCGSGIKTEKTSISSKGNQKGNINITGGELTIYSCEDAIEAAYDVVIENNPKIDIKTSDYSEYTVGSISGNANDQIGTKMYLRTNNNTYNYSVQFKNSQNQLTWVDAAYSTSKAGNRGTTYHFYELTKPNDAISMKVYLYQKTVTSRNENNATASSSFISGIFSITV